MSDKPVHCEVLCSPLGSKMAVMRAGEIVQVYEVKTIFAKPQNEFVARFLGYENVYKAQLIKSGSNGSIVAVEGVHFKISGTVNKPEKTVAILPEDITVHVSPIKRHGANTFKGAIIEYADMGPFVMLTVDAGLILKAVVTEFFHGERFRNGERSLASLQR